MANSYYSAGDKIVYTGNTAEADDLNDVNNDVESAMDLVEADIDLKLNITDIDDSPVNGVTNQPISSNWAYDHIAALDPHTGYVQESEVDDTPVNGATSDPISSNWAYDHENAADPHSVYKLESELGTAATRDAEDSLTDGANLPDGAAVTAYVEGYAEPIDATIIKQADVDDVPVNAASNVPVSSNWAYDHQNNTGAHDGTDIDLSTSNFDNNLSAADDTVQKALDTLNDLSGVRLTPPSGTELTGGIIGLDYSMNDTYPAFDIDIAIGACLDSTNTANLVLSTAMTKQLDVAWAAGTDDGAMRSGGALPTGGYVNVWIIGKADGTTDIMVTESGDTMNATNLGTWASGYSLFRWLGIVRTNADDEIATFIMNGNHISWNLMSESVLSTGIDGTFAAVDHSSFIPESRVQSIEYGVRDASNASEVWATDDGTNTAFVVGSAASTASDSDRSAWGAQASQKGSLKPYNALREFKTNSGTNDLLLQAILVKR